MTYKKNLIVLDCTLRDGGYYNNWNFTFSQITNYLKIIQEIGVDVVEIGFRFPNSSKRLGVCAKTDDNFLKKILPLKKKKFAVMINSSDYINNDKVNNDLLEKYFDKEDKLGIDLVRIASHFRDLELSNLIAKKLKNLGYEVCLNLMQISEINLKKLCNKLKKMKNHHFDVFYVADSLGSLNNKDIIEISKFLKKNIKKNIGIHAHNNQDLALSNTLIASKNNFTWLDGTFMGMGRGPGNAEIEKLLLNLSNNKMEDKINLLSGYLYLRYFEKLKKRFQWGPNYFYYLAGKYSIHPSYVQALSNTSDSLKKIKLLNKLKNLPNRNQFYLSHLSYNKSKNSKEFNFKKIKNNKFMIIGNGSSLKDNIHKIKRLIIREKLCVLLINSTNYITEEFIDYRVIFNPIQMLDLVNHNNYFEKPSIVPRNNISYKIFEGLKNIYYFDYSIKKFNSFEKEKNNLTLFFTKKIIEKLNPQKVYIVGIDGYKNKPYQNNLLKSVIEDFKKFTEINTNYSKILNSKIR